MEAPLVAAVVQHHVEAVGHGDDELVHGLVRMPPALRAAGHVEEVIDALDGKGDMAAPLDKGQIAPWVVDLGQVDEAAVVQTALRT